MSAPLHPIERTILTSLSSVDKSLDISELSSKSGLSIDQVRRGIEWLKAKQLIAVEEIESESYSLGAEGKTVAASGLPERRLVELIKISGGICEFSVASKSLGEEFSGALGRARRNNWIKIDGNKLQISGSVDEKTRQELMLERLAREDAIPADSLKESELGTINDLKGWHSGFIVKNESKQVEVAITEAGRTEASHSTTDEIDAITPAILQSGEWKTKPMRALDVTSPAPKVFPGRRHPMRLFMNEVRETFVSLGFEEIFGPMVQSALWNFDALFIPQEHSAREMQDTFYLSGLKANLEECRAQMKKIKSVHETGADTGSLGWQYRWREEEAERVVLRTHTTAVTISYLAKYKPSDARVFSVGRVFRNEKINYKRNPEFFQIEGVMVGENLNLRNMIYILSKFYSKLGFNQIKFWPTFFPYTEPSLQTMAYNNESKKWIELGGMGVFRPEVTLPLGVKNPVLAWGLGLDRLVMLKYGVSDIRQLFGANLDWLREIGLG